MNKSFALGGNLKIKINKNKAQATAVSIIRLVLLIGLAFIILYPLFLKFVESIKSEADNINPTVVFIPQEPTFENYSIIMKAINYPFTLIYSLLFISIESVIQAFSCAMVAYGFARFRFRGKNILFAFNMLTLIIPPQIMLIPIYLRFKYFGITNVFQFSGSLSGVNLTETILPFLLLSLTVMAFKNGLYVYLLRQYFAGLPVELEEAAYIDGCGPIKTFFKIMLPGAVSMLVTVFLFAFVWQWNDQFYAKILAPNLPLLITRIYDMNSKTVPAASNAILQALLANAKLILIILPLIILFVFAQRFFTESVERSGITG